MILTIAMIAGVIISALVEYLLHKHYLHRTNTHHHITDHHRNFGGDETFEHRNVHIGDIMSAPGYLAANILLYLPVGFIFSAASFNAAMLFMAAGIAYTLWIEIAHLYYHKPENDGIKLENLGFFNRMKEHHRTHHSKYGKNFGIGSSLWDKVLDTKQ